MHGAFAWPSGCVMEPAPAVWLLSPGFDIEVVLLIEGEVATVTGIYFCSDESPQDRRFEVANGAGTWPRPQAYCGPRFGRSRQRSARDGSMEQGRSSLRSIISSSPGNSLKGSSRSNSRRGSSRFSRRPATSVSSCSPAIHLPAADAAFNTPAADADVSVGQPVSVIVLCVGLMLFMFAHVHEIDMYKYFYKNIICIYIYTCICM